MASVETGYSRADVTFAQTRRRRRMTERLMLASTSAALLFALAVTFGFISG